MKILRNKWTAGFLMGVLIISLGLGAVVYRYGSQYEKTASVYIKELNWVFPLSTEYRTIAIDSTDENLYWCLGDNQVDFRDASGQVVRTENFNNEEEETTHENHGLPYADNGNDKGWESYQGREINSVWTVDENTFAVSFVGETPEEADSDYMLFDGDMKPVLGNRMFEVILKESDGMRYFISSDRTFDGKPVKKECGFLNEKGEVAFTFDHVPRCVNDFSEGLTVVYDNQLCAYNKEGKKVFAVDYEGTEIKASQRENHEEYTHYSPYYTQFVDGLAPVTLDGEKMGYMNREGKVIIEPIFERAEIVMNQTGAVCLLQGKGVSTLVNERWGILDLKEVL